MDCTGSGNENERLLWNLRSLPNELMELAGSLDDETLRWRPIPAKWSVKEIIGHLRDFERDAMHFRYRAVINEDNPFLPRLDNEAKQAEGNHANRDTAELLGEVRQLRLESIGILEQAPAGSWERTGIHFSAGPVTLAHIVARHVRHDLTHLAQIKDIIGLKLFS